MKLISVQSRGNRLVRVFEMTMGKHPATFGVFGKTLRVNKFEGFVNHSELLIVGVRESRALKAAAKWLEGHDYFKLPGYGWNYTLTHKGNLE